MPEASDKDVPEASAEVLGDSMDSFGNQAEISRRGKPIAKKGANITNRKLALDSSRSSPWLR